MDDKGLAKDAAEAMYRQPFSNKSQRLTPDLRDSNALEYIAAQSGRIATALEAILSHLQNMPNDMSQSQSDLEHAKRLLDEM